MSRYIKLLEESEPTEIGTKAANLKLVQEKTNYKIPKTLVLTSSFYRRLLLENSIKNPLAYNWEEVKLPTELEQELFQQIKEIFGVKPLVIRSSASCEDSPLLSFAGQYSSFLNIKGRKKILKAIRLCYGSLFSENAIIYAKLSGLDLRKEYMAIAIQEVAEISKSGIMFTTNPVTGNKDELLIEYGNGLGDRIVGGNIIPNLTKIDKKKARDIRQTFLRNVAQMGLDIEQVFSQPQDIEWGYSKANLYVFQSRPITTFGTKQTFSKNIQTAQKITVGTPTCQGSCTGKFRIIASVKDYRAIKQGDIILILNSPNIELIKNIAKIAGLIIPGGLLSHFAVMAREFNKPCITRIGFFDHKSFLNKRLHLDATNGVLYLTN